MTERRMPLILLDKNIREKNTVPQDLLLFVQHIFSCRPKTWLFLILSFIGLFIIIRDYRQRHRFIREYPDVLDDAIDLENLENESLKGNIANDFALEISNMNNDIEIQENVKDLYNLAAENEKVDQDEIGKIAPETSTKLALELNDIQHLNQIQENGEAESYEIYERSYIAGFQRFEVGKAQIKFLKEFQSPCFLENTTDEYPYGNNNMMQRKVNYKKKMCFVEGLRNKSRAAFVKLPALDRPYRLRCLPYFMLLGFAKCGSTDFQFRAVKNKYMVKGFTKEYYWWDQYRFTANATLSDYIDIFDSSLKDLLSLKAGDDNNPYYPGATGEMTTITLNSMAYWRSDPRNTGLQEPKYLTPHDLYSILPNVKFIVLMRNPVSRLYSHYNMWAKYRGFKVGAHDFHNRVVHSLDWWENCTKILPIRGCLYGSPPEVAPVEHELSSWWQKEYNHSGEFRSGLYSLFLTDWLQVFSREQFLFIRTEDYGADKLGTLNDNVYPFLNLPKVDGKEKDRVESMKQVFKQEYEPMLNETKHILTQFYQPYNIKLAQLLADDKWLWEDH